MASRKKKTAAHSVGGHVAESAELESLRREVRSLKRKLRGNAGGTARIMAAVAEAMKDQKTPVLPRRRAQSRKAKTEVAVLHLSDWQIGSKTEDFNTEIARERIHDQLLPQVRQIVEARRCSARVDELVILIGGDNIDGSAMRANQPWEVDSTDMEQAISTCPTLFSETVLDMAELFPFVRVYSVRGNHGRIGPHNGNANPKRVNWDTVSSEVARMQLGDVVDGDRVTWHTEVEDFYLHIDIAGAGLLLIHGDQFQGGGGFAGVPVASIVKKIARWADAMEEDFDVLMLGHYHNPTTLTVGSRSCYVNGTLKSKGEWELEELAMSTRPAQRLQFWAPDQGPVVDQVIWLD